jgi:hypothetical protein
VAAAIALAAMPAGCGLKKRPPAKPAAQESRPAPGRVQTDPYRDRAQEGPWRPERSDHLHAGAAGAKYESALSYAERNPADYPGIVKRLEDILEGADPVHINLLDKVRESISKWADKWDETAKQEWNAMMDSTKEHIARNDYAFPISECEKFLARHRTHPVYDEQGCAHLARLRREKEAFDGLNQIKTDLDAAGRTFPVEQVEEAEKLFWRIHGFGKKYEDVEPLVLKLNPILEKLWDQIDRLRAEEEEKRWRELLKDRGG